jgi:hypothetical protein
MKHWGPGHINPSDFLMILGYPWEDHAYCFYTRLSGYRPYAVVVALSLFDTDSHTSSWSTPIERP